MSKADACGCDSPSDSVTRLWQIHTSTFQSGTKLMKGRRGSNNQSTMKRFLQFCKNVAFSSAHVYTPSTKPWLCTLGLYSLLVGVFFSFQVHWFLTLTTLFLTSIILIQISWQSPNLDKTLNKALHFVLVFLDVFVKWRKLLNNLNICVELKCNH